MKRLLAVLGILAVLAALVLPAVLGAITRARIDAAVAESLPDARLSWQSGWTRSRLLLDDDALDARLELRHPPLPPGRLLALTGPVHLADPAATIELDAHIGLGGGVRISATAPQITTRTPVTWSWRQPQLAVSAARDGRVQLDGRAQRLDIRDGLGNRLVLDQVTLIATMQRLGDGLRGVELKVRGARPGEPESKLALHLEPLADAPLATLVETLGALGRAEPGSARAGIAALGAAGAFRQLAESGLVIRMPELILDGLFELEGTWHANAQTLALRGGGPRAVISDWWATIAGLQLQLPVGQARETAAMELERLAQQGHLLLDDQHVGVDIGAARPAKAPD